MKYCKYGTCRSDSRSSRPGFDPDVRFFRFPKPCLDFRKSGLSRYRGSTTGNSALPANFVKKHIQNCKQCSICDDWVRKCKRKDQKFHSISDITKDSYICSRHFDPDVVEIDYSIHLPGVPAPKRRRCNRSSRHEETASQDVPVVPGEVLSSSEPSSLSTHQTDMELPPDSVRASELIFDGWVTDPDSFSIVQRETFVVKRSVDTQTSSLTRSVGTETTVQTTQSSTSRVSTGTQTDNTSLEKRLQNENTLLKEENLLLIRKCKKRSPMNAFEKPIKNVSAVSIFYLGFTYSHLNMILKFLNIEGIPNYWNSNYETGCNKMFTPMQEFILTLLRLRGGLLLQDIAYRFDVSTGYVSSTTITWIQALYTKFDVLRPHMFPSRDKIQETLPKRFSDLKNIRVILDGAEIFCDTPQNFEQQSNSYSHYKAHSTCKFLVGCTPNGVISFISQAYEGSISDRELVIQSKFLDLLEQGDLILADRGFTIQDLTDEKKIQLNIPAFLRGRDKLTPQEEIATRNIAKNRIFIEHMVRRIKEYRLFKRVIPQSMRSSLSQCIFVCACLSNFNPPLFNGED